MMKMSLRVRRSAVERVSLAAQTLADSRQNCVERLGMGTGDRSSCVDANHAGRRNDGRSTSPSLVLKAAIMIPKFVRSKLCSPIVDSKNFIKDVIASR